MTAKMVVVMKKTTTDLNDEETFLDSLLKSLSEEINGKSSGSGSGRDDSDDSSGFVSSKASKRSNKRPYNEALLTSSSQEDSTSSREEGNNSVQNQDRSIESTVPVAPVTPIPKIFKTDLRRKFGHMFVNVMNSMDFTLIDSFFRKFLVPSAEFFKTCFDVHLRGPEMIIAYYGGLLQFYMDNVMRIQESHIKQRRGDPYTELVTHFTMEGTQVYDVNPAIIANKVQQTFAQIQPTELLPLNKRNTKRAKRLEVNSYESYLVTREALETDEVYWRHFHQFDPFHPQAWSNDFPLLPTPVPLQIEGTITFKINEEKRIESISISGISCV